MSRSNLLFCVSILAIALNSATAETIVLNNPTESPLTKSDKTGLLDIIATKAFEKTGYTLELVKLPAERGLLNANDGIDDGDLSRIEGLEKLYPNLIRVPEKLYDMKFSGFTTTVKANNVRWEDLFSYSVGLIRGWKILEKGVKNHPNVLYVRNADLLFQLIKKDHADIVLYSELMGIELARKMGIENIVVLQPPLETREMYIYLHKKHKAIVPTLARAIRDIKNTGEYDRVYTKIMKSIKN